MLRNICAKFGADRMIFRYRSDVTFVYMGVTDRRTDRQTSVFFAVLLLWDVDMTIKKVSALSEKKTDRQKSRLLSCS